MADRLPIRYGKSPHLLRDFVLPLPPLLNCLALHLCSLDSLQLPQPRDEATWSAMEAAGPASRHVYCHVPPNSAMYRLVLPCSGCEFTVTCTALCCHVLPCTAPYCHVPSNTALYRPVLPCIPCTAMYCYALPCTVVETHARARRGALSSAKYFYALLMSSPQPSMCSTTFVYCLCLSAAARHGCDLNAVSV